MNNGITEKPVASITIKKGAYYVYQHLIDGEVVYVGKGVGGRAFDTNPDGRGRLWADITKHASEIRVEIVRWFETEHEALEFERAEIWRLKPLANMKITTNTYYDTAAEELAAFLADAFEPRPENRIEAERWQEQRLKRLMPMEEFTAKFRHLYARYAILLCDGNHRDAAVALGIGRTNLYRILRDPKNSSWSARYNSRQRGEEFIKKQLAATTDSELLP